MTKKDITCKLGDAIRRVHTGPGTFQMQALGVTTGSLVNNAKGIQN